jgi:hypothetical protein
MNSEHIEDVAIRICIHNVRSDQPCEECGPAFRTYADGYDMRPTGLEMIRDKRLAPVISNVQNMPHAFNPLTIRMAIDFYTTPNYQPDWKAPAQLQAAAHMERAGLLESSNEAGGTVYRPNQRALEVYIEALERVPFPVQQWVIPENYNAIG